MVVPPKTFLGFLFEHNVVDRRGFEPTAKGTKLTKTTDYELPYSILGKMIDKIRVHKDMEKTDEQRARRHEEGYRDIMSLRSLDIVNARMRVSKFRFQAYWLSRVSLSSGGEP
jgi:hypothetical protein